MRDRDRIRQEILESLGWRNRIWRIWSTDWFRSPINETQRLVQFLEELKRQPIPREYLFDELREEEQALFESPAVAGGDEEQTQDLVFDDEEDELEIDVGDLVTYAPAESPDKSVQVRLTARQTNLDLGLVAESTPLGSVLMGATVGDTVVLRVPGKAPQTFVVQGVKRTTEQPLQ